MNKGRKKSKRTRSRKKSFGGYNIDFRDCDETMEQVFGKKPITPPQMTKKLWNYIKRYKLGGYN